MKEKNRLDLSNKLYQKTIWNNVLSIARGDFVIPSVVDLDPTSMCNLNCPDCISYSVLNTKTFKKEILLNLIEELAKLGTKAIVLIGGGEPLLYPYCNELIRAIGDNGMKIGIVTNGLLLHKYENVISQYVDWIRVSVDAATEKTFNQFRPSKNGENVFSIILQNIKSIANNVNCELGFSFLVMEHYDRTNNLQYSNADEIYSACQIAKELGCKYFEVKAMLDTDHFVHQYSPTIIKRIDSQVKMCTTIEDVDFEVVISSNLLRLLKGDNEKQKKNYESCIISQLRTCITPNGIYVCPYHRGNKNAFVGLLDQMSFSQIWTAYNHNLINPSKDCTFHCARHPSNLELINILKGEVNHHLLEDYDIFI